MVRLNPKMLSMAFTALLLMSLGCNSHLKVISKTGSVESKGTESTNTNTTPDSEGGAQDPNSENGGTSDSLGLVLRILADDGKYHQQDVILNSKQASASWDNSSTMKSTRLVIALDQS